MTAEYNLAVKIDQMWFEGLFEQQGEYAGSIPAKVVLDAFFALMNLPDWEEQLIHLADFIEGHDCEQLWIDAAQRMTARRRRSTDG